MSYVGIDGQSAAGVLIGEHIYRPEPLLGTVKLREPSVLGMLRQWDEVHPALDKAAKSVNPTDGKVLASVKLLAVILSRKSSPRASPRRISTTSRRRW